MVTGTLNQVVVRAVARACIWHVTTARSGCFFSKSSMVRLSARVYSVTLFSIQQRCLDNDSTLCHSPGSQQHLHCCYGPNSTDCDITPV
jgi:hypothetical protein